MFGAKKGTSGSSNSSHGVGLFSWAGSLAIFYLVILGLVSIPFIVLFLILFVRTVVNYQAWILVGIVTLLAGTVFLIIRRKKQIRERFEEEKKDVMAVITTAARQGHNVNISFMHGLIRLDYQGNNKEGRLVESHSFGDVKQLPMSVGTDEATDMVILDGENPPGDQHPGISMELERLSGLFQRGVLTETEFQELKGRLIRGSSHSG
jgi:hypothetical protein